MHFASHVTTITFSPRTVHDILIPNKHMQWSFRCTFQFFSCFYLLLSLSLSVSYNTERKYQMDLWTLDKSDYGSCRTCTLFKMCFTYCSLKCLNLWHYASYGCDCFFSLALPLFLHCLVVNRKLNKFFISFIWVKNLFYEHIRHSDKSINTTKWNARLWRK